MRNKYNDLQYDAGQRDILNWIADVTRNRSFDVDDFSDIRENTPRIYPAPSSSSDLRGTEKVGDIAVDTSYFYIVVDNGGTLQWQRVGTSTF